jgi:hypothetical protein
MGVEEFIMPSSLTSPGPWKWYKRYSDMGKVEARLVVCTGQKLMEVRETIHGEDKCPDCGHVLSLLLEPKVVHHILMPNKFHESHKPLDVDA